VDQLSIDQSTNAERSHQVQMMSDIYSNAASVIVWLGNDYTQPAARVASGSKTTNYYDALQTVLRSNYFDRLWVLQEFLLAKRVRVVLGEEWILYGDSRIPWSEEDIGPLRINLSISPRAGPVFRRSKAWRNCLHPNGRLNDRLDGLLLDFAAQACEDPRDKIYGLQGLVDPKDRLVVDYSKSPQEVYTQLRNKLHADCLERQKLHAQASLRKEELTAPARALYKLAGHMSFTDSQVRSLCAMLEHRLACLRSVAFCLPNDTKVGFDPGDEAENSLDRWWFDFEGQRQYFECTVGEINLEAACIHPATRIGLLELPVIDDDKATGSKYYTDVHINQGWRYLMSDWLH
jgi:hypothetical protein